VLLQILSNLANDYGDFKKGTDNANRVGPQREMQSGAITEKEMKWALVIVSGLCLLSGFLLLFVYYVAQVAVVPHYRFLFVLSFFIALGIGAVLAALLYTLGKRPYGYRGLGDLFCFLFFGWAAVAGTYYLSAPWFDFSVLLPATAMGFLSNAVLNINNMRDYENDKASGKNSLVVKLGLKKAFVYHCLLIIGAFICLAVYLVLHQAAWYSYLFLLLAILFIKDLIAIKKTKPELLDPFLGRQVKHSFLLVLVYGILMLV
jgi:1,4-dihydroxy-2-naphthoate octaprenyltransferase